jgi:hypothetical protein
MQDRPARATVETSFSGPRVATIGPQHSDGPGWTQQIQDAFGTASAEFADRALLRLANAIREKDENYPSDTAVNAALAILGALAPRDELEASIGIQLIAASNAAHDFLQRARANAGEYTETAVAYGSLANKLLRTVTIQLEALTKFRTGGKQQVIVKHIYINGPAVVGDHAQTIIGGGAVGGEVENVGQAHAPAAIAHPAADLCTSVWSEDTEGCAVSGAGGERAEEV